ncbi:5-methylcytosine rRNA methyltransferase NSUN4 [Myzus persicae]|uniref:5-methylcytosine rRNA methyltransferase NSUN4 n=1 Tax=Myzus persicae TaxID=13164 RepID=UPI000B930C96|nr:5-methylcytosine rRNA methyltransferase NSUN4 [Myzus persicae]
MFRSNTAVFLSHSLCHKHVQIVHVRTKKTHWSSIKKRIHPKDKALEHFDDFYGSVYGKRWRSIRLALLSPHKYIAIVNNFGDSEKVSQQLEWLGAMNIRKVVEAQLLKAEESTNEKNIQELDKKLKKLLLTDENELDTKQENAEYVEKASLHQSLLEAEHDESRIIDPEANSNIGGLYQFIPATELHGKSDWIPESQHYQYYEENSDFPINILNEESPLNIPPHLQVFTFDRGDFSPFPHPKTGVTKVSGYYLMDGGSILPIFALDLKLGDRVLDMCSAPGGKALATLQTLLPESLVCNDIQESRIKKIHNVMSEYISDYQSWGSRLMFTQMNARNINEPDVYNKILVDVPCTNDRHSLENDENNMFKPTRAKERLKLPEIQADILKSALMNIAVGGTVVYSTCSLSPIQNDGVVKMALKKIWEETNHQIIVKDLTKQFEPLKSLYSFGKGLKFGQMVMPFLPLNYGPLYLCKLVRVK